MVLFILRKIILQERMHSHLVGLDVWFLVDPLSTSILHVCKQRRLWQDCADVQARSGKTLRMRRLTWAFVGHLCDKYHNLMSWLIYAFNFFFTKLLLVALNLVNSLYSRCNLASVVLQLLAMGISDIVDFDFMDKPSTEVKMLNTSIIEKVTSLDMTKGC